MAAMAMQQAPLVVMAQPQMATAAAVALAGEAATLAAPVTAQVRPVVLLTLAAQTVAAAAVLMQLVPLGLSLREVMVVMELRQAYPVQQLFTGMAAADQAAEPKAQVGLVTVEQDQLQAPLPDQVQLILVAVAVGHTLATPVPAVLAS